VAAVLAWGLTKTKAEFLRVQEESVLVALAFLEKTDAPAMPANMR
jgi:hypothetical protein